MRKSLFLTLATACMALFVAGCSGGGGGNNVASSGKGYVRARVTFGDSQAARHYHERTGADAATATITVTVTIEGMYGDTDRAFTPVYGSVTIDPGTLKGSADLLAVPVGMNHLLTATATFSTYARESGTVTGAEVVKGIIENVSENETRDGIADARTTPAAEAFIQYAKNNNTTLNRAP